jgi:hypothetical protein
MLLRYKCSLPARSCQEKSKEENGCANARRNQRIGWPRCDFASAKSLQVQRSIARLVLRFNVTHRGSACNMKAPPITSVLASIAAITVNSSVGSPHSQTQADLTNHHASAADVPTRPNVRAAMTLADLASE